MVTRILSVWSGAIISDDDSRETESLAKIAENERSAY